MDRIRGVLSGSSMIAQVQPRCRNGEEKAQRKSQYKMMGVEPDLAMADGATWKAP